MEDKDTIIAELRKKNEYLVIKNESLSKENGRMNLAFMESLVEKNEILKKNSALNDDLEEKMDIIRGLSSNPMQTDKQTTNSASNISCKDCENTAKTVTFLNEHIEECETDLTKTKKEYEKVKKEKNKIVKEMDKKVRELRSELDKYYLDVDKLYQENVKLAEHNKTLEEVLKVNTELHDKLKDMEDKLAGEEEITIEDPTPTSQKYSGYTCKKCEFKCHTMGLLRRHVKQKHTSYNFEKDGTAKDENVPKFTDGTRSVKCDQCTFTVDNDVALVRHITEKHTAKAEEKKFPCRFWRRGSCKKGLDCDFSHEVKIIKPCRYWARGTCSYGSECRFAHNSLPECRYGDNCRAWPNCRFQHESSANSYCRYQENCQDSFCSFVHFLGHFPPQLDSYQEFPSFPTAQGRVPFSQW